MCPTVFGIGFPGMPLPKRKYPELYKRWQRMLERAYCPKWKARKPSYEGVKVCRRWHNFSNFLADAVDILGYQDWLKDKTMQLDKDTIVKGNKTYGPGLVAFVSRKTNSRQRTGPTRARLIRHIPSGRTYRTYREAGTHEGFSDSAVGNHCRGQVSNPKFEVVDENS